MALENEAGPQAGSERILGLIKRRGPQRAAGISLALGVTREAARQQLARLLRLGLVYSVTERQGVGRPARAFALTDAGHGRFPDRHAELTVQLIDAVRAEFGEGAVDRMIARRDYDMRGTYAASMATVKGIEKRVERLAALRSNEGYMAEVTPAPGGWLLTENHCPICAAATICQGFCRSELDVFRAVLGDDVSVERTEHVLVGARRCAYLITQSKREVNDGNDGVDRRDAGRGTRSQEKKRGPS